MTAVGDYEVIVEEIGPFSQSDPDQAGYFDAPVGKVFLSASFVKTGNAGLAQVRLDGTGTRVHWSLITAEPSSAMTIFAPCAKLGQ